jgi:hypothetical protein
MKEQRVTTIGIDLAKTGFHVVGMAGQGRVVRRKRLSRDALMPFIAQLPPARIGVEACGSAHYWARRFQEHGQEVKLRSPQVVTPYVESNKHDSVDAAALCEAVPRPTLRFVPIKTREQQDWHALHRVRERVVTARTALVNEMRSLLAEYGIVRAKGITRFRRQGVECLEQQADKLSVMGHDLFQQLYEEFTAIEQRPSVRPRLGAFASRPSRDSAPWPRRPLWPRSATSPTFRTAASSRLGSAWSRGNTRPVGDRTYGGLVKAVTSICVSCWSTGHGRPYAPCPARAIAPASGPSVSRNAVDTIGPP